MESTVNGDDDDDNDNDDNHDDLESLVNRVRVVARHKSCRSDI